VRINSLLTIPVLGFLFVAAPDILGIIYAGPYVAATSVLRLLVGIRIITRICAGGENADLLLSMNMVKPLVAIGVIAACVTIALHAVLIPRFSAEGAAVASGLGTLAANVLGVRRAQRVLPVTIQWRSWFALTGLTLLAGGGAHLAVPAAPTLVLLAAKLAIFSVVWLFTAVLVRPLEMHDAAVFGRSLALLRKPMELLSRREGSA
jgi:O-antigen/teichoic acid export membrane protein